MAKINLEISLLFVARSFVVAQDLNENIFDKNAADEDVSITSR
jgi:hypothetical protein|tara:strand:+ start:369 stop:497 length:129 start_codon:yes stop_codon:yes gene_type:complete